MRRIVPLLLLIALFGCSTSSGQSLKENESSFEAKYARYQALASEPPPETWRIGADWEFVAFDKNDAIAESYVFRVTDTPQTACLSGDWKKLEVVGGDAAKLRNPAYAIEGRNLQILLSTAMCDAYPMYRGELSDDGFIGTHDFSHLLGGEEYGKVAGKPVHVSPTPAPSTGHVAFTVKRGDCGSPEELDLDHWKDVKSQWRSDGALEVTLWDTETQEYSVIDDSASLDASAPGTLRLFYRVKHTPLPPDSPVVFCEDWVKLIFVIHGVARSPYRVTVETTRLVREADIEG